MTTVIDAPTSSRSQIKSIRPDVIERLVQYKSEKGLTDERLGQLIDSNGTQVNRALNGKFLGDVAAFESKVEEFFKNEPERSHRVGNLFLNVFAKNMHAFLKTVTRTMDAAVAWSAAGKGKTSSVALFAFENPAALVIEATKWACGSRGMEKQIWKAVDTRAWKKDCSRSEFLVERFKGRPRLIIVDNAQRLRRSGWEWVLDFHDATGSPIAFVGHKDLLNAAIRSDDQLFSRIGQSQEIKGGNAASDSRQLIEIYWPEAVGKLGTMPEQVLKQPGHMRSLKKQLLLAREMAEDFSTPAEAFRAAHTQLIRNFKLEEE